MAKKLNRLVGELVLIDICLFCLYFLQIHYFIIGCQGTLPYMCNEAAWIVFFIPDNYFGLGFNMSLKILSGYGIIMYIVSSRQKQKRWPYRSSGLWLPICQFQEMRSAYSVIIPSVNKYCLPLPFQSLHWGVILLATECFLHLQHWYNIFIAALLVIIPGW